MIEVTEKCLQATQINLNLGFAGPQWLSSHLAELVRSEHPEINVRCGNRCNGAHL